MSCCWVRTGAGTQLSRHNHRRGALKWQVLFRTAGTELTLVRTNSEPADRSSVPSPSSCWHCLPRPVAVQGGWRKFRYLYTEVPHLTLLTIKRDEGGNRSVPGEPVLRGQQTRRPLGVQDRTPGPWRQLSAAWRGPLPPGTELSGLPAPGPTHRSLGGGPAHRPRAGSWARRTQRSSRRARRGGCVHT